MAGQDEEKANRGYSETVQRFANSGFSDGTVANFFKGPDPLFTTQISIPQINADDGPKAFNLQGRVKPKRWFITYRGKVTPAESGKYRFVGAGDDVLVLRFNDNVVLDAGMMRISDRRAPKQYAVEGHSQPGAAGQ
jgi:hypothetical protein